MRKTGLIKPLVVVFATPFVLLASCATMSLGSDVLDAMNEPTCSNKAFDGTRVNDWNLAVVGVKTNKEMSENVSVMVRGHNGATEQKDLGNFDVDYVGNDGSRESAELFSGHGELSKAWSGGYACTTYKFTVDPSTLDETNYLLVDDVRVELP